MSAAIATAPVAAINDPDTRRRLTPHAIAGFLGVAERWRLTVKDQQALLGGLGRARLIGWRKHQRTAAVLPPLSVDVMMRISFLLGMCEGLERLFRRTPAVADSWVTRANTDAPFHGRTPLVFMQAGGLPAMAAVRAYVDAWTSGP